MQIERASDLTDAGVFDGYRVVGITGGTSTPIEDLETVAARVLELAGTTDVQAQAPELAQQPSRRSPTPHTAAPPSVAPTDARSPPRAARRSPRRTPECPLAAIGARPGSPTACPSTGCPWSPSWDDPTWASPRCSIASSASEWPSWRTAHGPRVTGCMPPRSGTAAGSWSSTPVASSERPGDPIEEKVQEQARLAIGEADLILFVVDAASGLTPSDAEAAAVLRRAKVPVIVAANKADNEKRELEAAEAWGMGWEETYAVSAQHGRGTGDLLDAIVWALPPESEAELERKRREEEVEELAAPRGGGHASSPSWSARRTRPRVTTATSTTRRSSEHGTMARVAIVGRPNVGKSSLLNSLLGEERVDRERHPGHDPGRHRHPARVARPAGDASWTPRASGAGARSRPVLTPSGSRPSAPCAPSGARTSRCWCSIPWTG